MPPPLIPEVSSYPTATALSRRPAQPQWQPQSAAVEQREPEKREPARRRIHVARNIGVGVTAGLKVALVVLSWAVLFRVLGGWDALYAAHQLSNVVGLRVRAMAVVFSLGGVATGFLCGLLLPLSRFAWGAMLVGVMAGIPTMWAVKLAISPAPEWFRGPLEFGLLAGIPVGMVCGLMHWYAHHGYRNWGLSRRRT